MKNNYLFLKGYKINKKDLIKYKDLPEEDLFFLVTKNINVPGKSCICIAINEQYFILGYALCYIQLNQKVDWETFSFSTTPTEEKVFTLAWNNLKLVKSPEQYKAEVYFV